MRTSCLKGVTMLGCSRCSAAWSSLQHYGLQGTPACGAACWPACTNAHKHWKWSGEAGLGRARGGGGGVKDGAEQGAEGQAEAMGGKWGPHTPAVCGTAAGIREGQQAKVGARV